MWISVSELTVELIADGRHLPASLLRLAYQSMGTRRVALVTDALRGAGMPEGESVIGSLKEGRKCIIEDGVAKLPDRSAFAGSVATADRLVRNMVRMAGAPLLDAVKMMSLTPARIMGFSGSRHPGAGVSRRYRLPGRGFARSENLCGRRDGEN